MIWKSNFIIDKMSLIKYKIYNSCIYLNYACPWNLEKDYNLIQIRNLLFAFYANLCHPLYKQASGLPCNFRRSNRTNYCQGFIGLLDSMGSPENHYQLWNGRAKVALSNHGPDVNIQVMLGNSFYILFYWTSKTMYILSLAVLN